MPETSEGQGKDPKGFKSEDQLDESTRKKLEIFNNIDAVYKTQPKFKEVFDRAMKGDYSFMAEQKAAEEKGEVDPFSGISKQLQELSDENKKLRDQVNGVTNAYGWDKVSGVRKEISINYEEKFADLAEKEGYEFGSKAYDNLMKSAKDASFRLANKYGLVDKQTGAVDPLLKFSPEMIQEAFKIARDEHKQMGYDIEEQRRKEATRRSEEQRKAKSSEFDSFLKKENLKTLQDRSKVFGEMYNKILRDNGVTQNDMKSYFGIKN